MEGCSGGEEKKLLEEENKVKRKMKSASQLEILEKAYAAELYPSEALRDELSVKLGLSDRQLQMWFCHRRVKDRKASSMVNKVATASLALMGEEGVEQIAVADVMHAHRVVQQYRVMGFTWMGAGLPALESSSCHKAHQTLQELRAVALVERQLGKSCSP